MCIRDSGKLGLTQAEAVMDLISADGRQGAALANAALGLSLIHILSAFQPMMMEIQTKYKDKPEKQQEEMLKLQLCSYFDR